MGVGTLTERIGVASTLLTELPKRLSWAQGASLPLCSLTAQLLVDGAGVSKGDRVAVTGAAGMVGGFTVELARAPGATVAGAVRDADAEEARRLGVDATVVAGGDLGRLLGEWAPGGVDACLDTVGVGAAALGGIRDGGRFVSTVPGSLPEMPRGITADVVQVQPNPAVLEALAQAAASGRLTVRVAETLPWGEFRRGYQLLQAGGLRGKIVLTF
jgi:NADPH:quinone reductase-like Zn-dependent oxidoreductase